MFRQLSNWFYRQSSGWAALTGTLMMLVFIFLVLPAHSAQTETYSAGIGTPDTTWLYSTDDLIRMATAYGKEGRQAYIAARFSFDLAWPLVYTFFLITGISWLLARGLKPENSWRLLNLAPLAAMLLDLLENSSAAWVMAAYPKLVPVAALLAPAFSLIKWLLVGFSFMLLPAALVLFIFHRTRANA